MTNPLAYLGIFLAVLGESTIIVGTFVPGLNTVISAAFLASAGKLDIWLVFAVSWIGIFIGDFGGYILGRYGLDRIAVAERWFNKARPSVESFLDNHRRLVVLYQFIGFARAPLPIFLGSVRHPIRKWISLLLRATTLFMAVLIGGSYWLGRAVGEKAAIKIAVISQIVVAVVFLAAILQIVITRYYRHAKLTTGNQHRD